MTGSAPRAGRTPPRGGLVVLLATAASVLAININHAQPAGDTKPGDFSSVEYYPAPNQMQMKSRLAGVDVQSMEGGLYLIKQLRLEMFSTNGQPQVIVKASDCIYDVNRQEANSAGKLLVQNGDGKIRIEGEGFRWRQNDSLLTVSNQVRTTIETDLKQKFGQ